MRTMRLCLSCELLWPPYEDERSGPIRARALIAWCHNSPTPAQKEPVEMRVDHREDELENHDRGLDYDLPRLLQRRGMLKLVLGASLAGSGLVSLAACADDTGAAAAPTGPEGAPTDAGGPPDGGSPGGGAET